MAILISDNLQNNSPKALEAKGSNFTGGRAKPFTSVAAAHAPYSSSYRNEVDIVWVEVAGVPIPHQYVGGYAENNLVPAPFIPTGAGSATYDIYVGDTLTGNATQSTPLNVDTTVIATKTYVDDEVAGVSVSETAIQAAVNNYLIGLPGYIGDGNQSLRDNIEWVQAGSNFIQLTTPTSFSASATSDTQINLTWNDIANENSYEIQRSTNATTGFTVIATPAANATSYNDTGLTASTTYYYKLKGIGDGTTYSNSAYVMANTTTNEVGVGEDITSNMVMHLPLDGSYVHANTNIYTADNVPPDGIWDVKVQPFNITWVAGNKNNAALLNGTSSYLTWNNNPHTSPGTSDYSVSFWLNLTALDDDSHIVYEDTGAGTIAVNFAIYPDDKIFFGMNDGTNGLTVSSANALSASTWYHVVATRAGGTLKMYINGSLDNTTTGTMGDVNVNGDLAPIIGMRSNSFHTGGKIDEFRIYKRALTLPEITALYNY